MTRGGENITCYNPNYIKIFDASNLTDEEYYSYKINAGWKRAKNKKLFYKFINANIYETYRKNLTNEKITYYSIPCNKCTGCLLDYSRNWANRCYLETLYHKNNYFITLSYNDENLNYGPTGNKTLKPKDVELFIKRLRKHYQEKYNLNGIKYLLCGEYGEQTWRPHYHIIFFGLPIPDITTDFKSIDKDGKIQITQHQTKNIYYWSEAIQKLWGLGNILIGQAEYNSCAYVARYVMKKQKGTNKNDYKKYLQIEPEFIRMSKGIGEQFFIDKYQDIYWKDNITIYNGKATTIKPPRYFDRKLEEMEGGKELLEWIKEKRKQKEIQSIITEENMIQSKHIDILKNKENIQQNRIIGLIRSI